MSQPALIVLAHGSRDRRSARAVHEIVSATRRLRPDLSVEAAFLEHSYPDLTQVVERLAQNGRSETVVVPLFLTAAYHARVDAPAAAAQAETCVPGVSVSLADVVGTHTSLLTALDERLAESLRSARSFEPDALVLASAGTSDPEANLAMARLAELWGHRHDVPASVGFASSAEPRLAEAVRRWTRLGCRRVVVGSLFIAPGTLPDRVRVQGLQAGAVAVSRPLGAHIELARVILSRYLMSASEFGVLV